MNKSEKLVDFLETNLQFYDFVLAREKGCGYATGYAKTTDEDNWKLDKTFIKVPRIGLIAFDYMTEQESLRPSSPIDESSDELEENSDELENSFD